jgi:hypothetical protein
MKVTFEQACHLCQQDLLKDCKQDHAGKPCLIAKLHNLVLLAEDVWFSRDDLRDMLNGGMTPAEIIDLMIFRASAGRAIC